MTSALWLKTTFCSNSATSTTVLRLYDIYDSIEFLFSAAVLPSLTERCGRPRKHKHFVKVNAKTRLRISFRKQTKHLAIISADRI